MSKGGAWVWRALNMERFRMNLKRSLLAVTTAALLTAATVTAASAHVRERGGASGSAGVSAGQNLGPGRQT